MIFWKSKASFDCLVYAIRKKKTNEKTKYYYFFLSDATKSNACSIHVSHRLHTSTAIFALLSVCCCLFILQFIALTSRWKPIGKLSQIHSSWFGGTESVRLRPSTHSACSLHEDFDKENLLMLLLCTKSSSVACLSLSFSLTHRHIHLVRKPSNRYSDSKCHWRISVRCDQTEHHHISRVAFFLFSLFEHTFAGIRVVRCVMPRKRISQYFFLSILRFRIYEFSNMLFLTFCHNIIKLLIGRTGESELFSVRKGGSLLRWLYILFSYLHWALAFIK